MVSCRVRGAVLFTWGVVLVLTSFAFGHLCNNIYRTPDRVIVKPEKPTATVVGNEEFRVFVQNNYPTYLDNLRLGAKLDAEGVSVSVTPASIKRLKAGERTAFKVKLTSRPGAKSGRHVLSFGISADNIDWLPVEQAKVQDFQRVLREESNLSATIQAAESLVSRRDPQGSSYLAKLAARRDVGADYQGRAIRALGKGGDKKNVPFLRTMLEQRDGFVRGNVLLALGLLGDRASTFEPFYGDRDEFVRACATAGRVLAGGKDKQQLQTLSQGLKSSNPYVRIACGWGLASRRDQAAIAVLDRDFITDDAMQRVTAGDALVDVANRR